MAPKFAVSKPVFFTACNIGKLTKSLRLMYEFHHDLLLSEEPKQPGHGLGKKHGRSNEVMHFPLYYFNF